MRKLLKLCVILCIGRHLPYLIPSLSFAACPSEKVFMCLSRVSTLPMCLDVVLSFVAFIWRWPFLAMRDWTLANFLCQISDTLLQEHRKNLGVVSNVIYVHPYLGKIPILTHICQRVVQPPTSRSLRLMLPVTRLSRKGVLFLAREDVFLAWVCQSASWLLQLNPLQFVQLATFLGYLFVVIKICIYCMLQIQCTPKNL